MHAATEALGMMASLTSFLLWLPQGARVWKHRHDPSQLGGIAMSTQVISLAGNLLWGVYAMLIGSFWLGAPAVVNGPIAIGTILVLRRGAAAARAAEAASTTPAVRRVREVHDVFDLRQLDEMRELDDLRQLDEIRGLDEMRGLDEIRELSDVREIGEARQPGGLRGLVPA